MKGTRMAVWRRGALLALLALACAIAAVGGNPALPSDPLLTLGNFLEEPLAAEAGSARLVSFNLHGPPTERIEPVVQTLKTHEALRDAAVYSLQEVNRDHAGSGNEDVARRLAEALGVQYAYAVELAHENGGGVRGLALLSRRPMSAVERFVLPVEGPGGRRRIALGATIELGPKLKLRVYNLHLETRISVKERGEQIQAILDHARAYSKLPTAILGDFNTFTGGASRKMFELMEGEGFHCPLRGDEKTFQQKFFIRLKLDWIWLRNLHARQADVEGEIVVSDHRPLWVDLDLRSLDGASEDGNAGSTGRF